jgi:hypothetical protein
LASFNVARLLDLGSSTSTYTFWLRLHRHNGVVFI